MATPFLRWLWSKPYEIRGSKGLYSSALLMLLFWTGCTSNDASHLENLLPPVEARGLSVTWLGVAGILVDDGETKILIDPFVSRDGLDFASVLYGKKISSDENTVIDWVNKLNAKGSTRAILVTHGHYDHSLDAANFQIHTSTGTMPGGLTEARIFGSHSVVNITRREGVEPVPKEINEKTEVPKFGKFRIRFFQSEHSQLPIIGIPYAGTNDNEISLPAKPSAFKVGQVYNVLIMHDNFGCILHVGSPGYKLGKLEKVRADIAILAAEVFGSSDDEYIRQTAGAVHAKTVIPIHYDSFFRPLNSSKRLQSTTNLKRFVDRVWAILDEDSVDVVTLPLGVPRVMLSSKTDRPCLL